MHQSKKIRSGCWRHSQKYRAYGSSYKCCMCTQSQNRIRLICIIALVLVFSIVAFFIVKAMWTKQSEMQQEQQVITQLSYTDYKAETRNKAAVQAFSIMQHSQFLNFKSMYETDVQYGQISFDEQGNSAKTMSPDATVIKTVSEPLYVYEATQEEKIELAKLVYAEGRGEPFDGKVAIVAVALNRLNSNISWFDKESIIRVISQKSQFADYTGVTEEQLAQCPSCMEAVESALMGNDPTREYFEDGALYFFNPDNVKGKAKGEREGIDVYMIGNHAFHVNFEKK